MMPFILGMMIPLLEAALAYACCTDGHVVCLLCKCVILILYEYNNVIPMPISVPSTLAKIPASVTLKKVY